MEFDITNIIEKTLKDLIGEKRGPQIARLYRRYWNPINYVIVCGIGVGINMLILLSLAPVFELWIANVIAIFTAWIWNWSNTVGPFCHLWGFKKQDKEPTKPEKIIKIDGVI